MFDKKSSDFCFEKSHEILSKPFAIDLNPATLDKRYFDKKTRDLIGENLLDIEKTLNALNSVYLQATNELEKTDSTETLFGESFLLENNLKTQSSLKSMANFKKFTNEMESSKKKTRDYFSPLDKMSNASDKSYSPKDSQRTTPNSYSPQETTATSRGFFFNYSSSGGSVGGGALNINRNLFLSPTKRMGFNVSNQNFVPQTRKFDDSFASVGSPRQRSMSFTDNFEIKSPILLKPQIIKSQLNTKSMKASSMEDDGCFILPSQSQLIANKPRNIITYKPKTVRARNLRRLSYNPLNMTNSSSSSDNESDMDHSMAHSECDIRTKMYSSRFQKRRQQFLTNHRKLNNSTSSGYYDQNSCRNHSQYSNNSSIGNVNGRNKLYGSNSSIKSAPHYNYISDRKKYLNDDLGEIGGFGVGIGVIVGGCEEKTTMSSDNLDSNEEFENSMRTTSLFNTSKVEKIAIPTSQLQHTVESLQTPTSNFNNIYEFVGKCFNRNNTSTTIITEPIQQQKFLKNKNNYGNVKGNKMSSSNLDLLYTDFDVTKLTGKSPTTQSYFDIMDYSNNLNNKKLMEKQQQLEQQLKQKEDAKVIGKSGNGTFHWPEQIHGSTVKQNDLIWQLQQQHEQDLIDKQERQLQTTPKNLLLDNFKIKQSMAYSSDTSSTENDSINFRQHFMPPNPAP